MMEEARSLAGSLLGQQLAPSSLHEAATDELLTLLPVLRRLPRRLDRITASLERGALTTNVRLFADERDISFAAAIINRAVMEFAGASLGVISAVLLAIQGGPALLPGPNTAGPASSVSSATWACSSA
jgi:ubiquinone biosynthesis protein